MLETSQIGSSSISSATPPIFSASKYSLKMQALLERTEKLKYGSLIFNTKIRSSVGGHEVFKIYHLQKLEGYKVQVNCPGQSTVTVPVSSLQQWSRQHIVMDFSCRRGRESPVAPGMGIAGGGTLKESQRGACSGY